MGETGFFIAFLAGLASFLSPCVLPLVPAYLGLVAGQETKRAKRVFYMVWFVFGFSFVFVLLGAGTSLAGGFVKKHFDIFQYVAGGFLIVMGLYYLELIKLSFLNQDKRFFITKNRLLPKTQTDKRIEKQIETHTETQTKIKNKTQIETHILSGFLLGLAFGFGWTPCIGPILASILALSAVKASLNQGMLLLIIYSLGLGVGFLLAGLGGSFVKTLLPKTYWIKKISGAMIVLTGFALMLGELQKFGFYILDLFPNLGLMG